MNDEFSADRPEFEWLVSHASGWQFGEQGILIAIAEAIGQTEGQCVEIGAGNGESLPLTIDPFYHRGNSCLLFERDLESLSKLVVAYPNATHRGEFVPQDQNDMKDEPLLVVIDVDGIDSVIMDVILKHLLPSILMVEHFDEFHPSNCNHADRIPAWLLGEKIDGGFSIQDNAKTLDVIARQSYYTRVGSTRVNSIFVHESLVEKVTNYVPG